MPFLTLIGTAIGGALFGVGTLAASIAGSVITGALSFGARLALSYLNRPKPQAQTAIRGQVRAGAGIDCAVLYGEDKVKGHLQYYAKWGAGNSRNAYVKKLADGWCDGLAPYVYVFGEQVDLVEQTPVGNEAARYTLDGWGSAIVLRFYDGRPGQLADSELVAATAGLDTPWLSTSRGTNICYVVEDQTYDAAAFSRGLPEITYVLRGLREYDVRKDSTVSGGSGAHRLNDRSTWEFTQNNAVHRLNYLLGHRGVLSGGLMVGVGKAIDEIDVAMHMVAANVCDTERTVGGRTIPTYQCNQWASAGDDHLAILRNIEDAMAGYAVNSSGLDGVLAGAPQIPVREITARDIRADGEITGSNHRRKGESFNVLSGQFSAKETGFEPEGLKTVTVNADIEEDGGKRAVANDFLQVSDPDIAQYLLNIRYRQNRRAKRRRLPVSRELFYAVQNGEWVTHEGADWLLVRRGFDRRFRCFVELAETSAEIYSEDGIEAGPVVLPKPSPINPSLISTVANFGVASGLITGTNGAQIPALEFTWDDPQDPTVTQVRIEYRKAGTTEPVMPATATDVDSGSLFVTQGIQSGLNYEARATITTVPDRLKSWTSWETTAVATPSIQVILDELAQDAKATLVDIRADLNNALAIQVDMANSLQLAGMANYKTISKVGQRVGNAEASITVEQDVRASGDEALAAQLVTFETSLNGVAASVATETLARSTADDALAAEIVTLNSNVGSNAAAISSEASTRASADTAISTQLDTLSSTVTTETADRISGDASNASSISTVSANLATEASTRATADAANASSITMLSASLTTETSNRVSGDSTNASAISTVAANLATETSTRVSADSALASDINVLEATLTDAEGDISANASAISATQAEVTTLDGVVTALSLDLTAVEAVADDATASGLFKIESAAGSGDVVTKLTLYGRATAGGAYRDGGAVLEVTATSARWKFFNDSFLIAKTDGTPIAVFGESGADLILQSVKVDWALINNVSIGSAQIADASITNAKIANLTIQTSNIGLGMILAKDTMTGTIFPATSGSWTTVATVTIANPSGDYPLIEYTISQSGTRAGGGSATTLTTRFRRVTGNVTIGTIFGSVNSGVAGNVIASQTRLMLDQAPSGSVTYAVEYISTGDATSVSPSVTGTVLLRWSKR